MNRTLASCPCVLCFLFAAAYGAPPKSGDAQLGAPISWIPVPQVSDTYLMGQVTRDDQLVLTPNESFFPKLGLIADGQGKVPDIDNLNGGKSFATIKNWKNETVAQWGLLTKSSGTVRVRVFMTATAGGASFRFKIGKETRDFEVAPRRTGEDPVFESEVPIDDVGPLIVELVCRKSVRGLTFQRIELSGAGLREAAVLRKRWRPAAAHTKFSSSREPQQVRLWVMEMDAVPGELGFYSPITTPFGYYGPTWNADGTVGASFNFSLWSFQRGKPSPPTEQLSHLLAVGNRSAEFGGFDHEGTGVKVRRWDPLEGQQGQRQTMALRVEPGEVYDTYYSYYYAGQEKRWRLFGVGNKFNSGKPMDSLWVGSFVEVPGPPPRQRSGSTPRTMRYRGWVMTANGKWYPLDQMSNGNVNRETGWTHTDRGSVDGWFYLKTGGWTFRKAKTRPFTPLSKPEPMSSVDYLSRESIAYLTSVPVSITVQSASRRGSRVRLQCSVRGADPDAQVEVHWGPNDELTLADRWQNKASLGVVTSGQNDLSFDIAATKRPIFLRLLLTGQEGKYWTTKTTEVR